MVHCAVIVVTLTIFSSALYVFCFFESSINYTFSPTFQFKNNETERILIENEKQNSLLSVQFLRDYYSKYAHARVMHLNSITAQSGFATLYNVLVPEVYCPNLIRVGNVNDGGKWVCNPAEMPRNCSIFSLGLREDISFDRDLQEFNENSCELYGFDMIAQSDSTRLDYSKINGKLYKKTIAERTDTQANMFTIEDCMRENGVESMEMLKMDIEGAEYQVIVPFLQKHKPCQVFIELHGLAYDMLSLLHAIARQDYFLFFYEINGDSLKACEYSFIHSSCLKAYGLFPLSPYLKNLDKKKYLPAGI
ncbi:unnamed protein product [Auanema sp. JU1783]|nr:unnamed protein product [Auanema sp. JU1783]